MLKERIEISKEFIKAGQFSFQSVSDETIVKNQLAIMEALVEMKESRLVIHETETTHTEHDIALSINCPNCNPLNFLEKMR